MLYSENNAMFLLGCICNNPSLLRSGKYPLNRNDFKPLLFHYHLFAVINNLAMQGLETITEVDVGNFIDPYPTTKKIIEENDGLAFVRNIRNLAKAGNINMYYNIVRKFGLLRTAQENGINIEDIITHEMNDEQQIEAINKYTIDELLGIIDKKFSKLSNEYRSIRTRDEMWAGENFIELLQEFKQNPEFGACLNSPYETAIMRGFQKGYLLLRGASSGGGKTVSAVADLCFVSVKKLYDKEKQKFVDNPNFVGKGLYILTEMDMEKQLQPRFISYIADVEYHKILNGDFNKEEEERLIEASKILLDSGIKLVDTPEFTFGLLEDTIREAVMSDGIEYVVFDYMQTNPSLSREMKELNGSAMRDDLILLQLATKLKNLAETYDIGILTMCQLNGNEKTAEIIDASCLSGAKSMQNKIDYGEIVLPLSKKELDQIKARAVSKGYSGDRSPNRVAHVFKSRFSRYPNNLKIFYNIDMSTGHREDCFCTNQDNVPINVDRVYPNK